MRKTLGQIAYEKELEEHPFYEDGRPRVTWAQLPDTAKWSWERDPTPRRLGGPLEKSVKGDA